MIWTNIQDIPYTFLKDAVLSISKKYKVEKVRTDPKGEVLIKCSGNLSGNNIEDILGVITPGGLPKGYTIKYDIDYTQAETGLGWKTYIYSLEGIDYTKL